MASAPPSPNSLRRRALHALLATSMLLPACTTGPTRAPVNPIARAAPLVKPRERWSANQLNEFLVALPDDAILSLMKTLALIPKDADTSTLKGRSNDVREIQEQLKKVSTGPWEMITEKARELLLRPGTELAMPNYHAIVERVALHAGINKSTLSGVSTFALERMVQQSLFASLWDTLTPAQRLRVLNEIEVHRALVDRDGKKLDKAVVTAMSGAAAIAALSATIAFTGFAFYTSMSVAIAAIAAMFGLTLPFAVYMGTSSAAAVLAGPWGWVVAATLLATGLVLISRDNVAKAAAFVWQLHSLKIAALLEAGLSEQEVMSYYGPIPI